MWGKALMISPVLEEVMQFCLLYFEWFLDLIEYTKSPPNTPYFDVLYAYINLSKV